MPDGTLQPDANTVGRIAGWARRAGQIALRHFNAVTPRLKADHSFVTRADLEIEQFLTERFRAAFPAFNLLSEEGTRVETTGPAPSGLWAIDPLDGTTAFVHGLPGWGISIGLLVGGRPAFGLFYMPLLNDMTWAGALDGADSPPPFRLGVRSSWGEKGFLAVSSSAHRDFHIGVPRTRALGSVGANLVYMARGSAAAAFISRARLWDLVAGAAIVTVAGGELRYLSGKPIDYPALLDGQPAPEPVIAGHPRLLDELAGRITRRPPPD